MTFELKPLTYQLLSEYMDNELEKRMHMNGIGFALLKDGNPVALAGIAKLWPGVGKAWTLITEEAQHSPLLMRRIHFHAARQLPIVMAVMGLVRVEADTEAESPKGCKWLERLGFRFEGKMEKYRDGKTFARYALLET